tara:strand:- start:171 stop:410 length:240 start_codon:yes stop_codon:yes gene_type:complete
MTKKIKFKLKLTNNTLFDSSKINKKIVLFFYPKAMTSGCSIEVEDFQKKLSTFKYLGLILLEHLKTLLKEIISFLKNLN